MKLLRDKSLRHISIVLLTCMFVIYLAEYFIIRHKINVLDEIEQKLDFTRRSQLSGQQISLLLTHYQPGNMTLAADVEHRFAQQDQRLEILGNGGRIERTDVILKPLSRLPRISYDNLMRYWREYKQAATALLAISGDVALPASTDSFATYAMPSRVNTPLADARVRQESLSLTLSHWYDNLFNDLEQEVSRKKASLNDWVIFIIFFDIVLLVLVFFGFEKYVLKPLKDLRESTADHRQVTDLPKNEVGELALQINDTLENLKDATDFVTAIGQGNLSIDYRETLDSGYRQGRNKLADSLIEMQGKLKNLHEEERKRQWANEGLAKFVDILRSSNDNLHVLGDRIIAALTQYTGSNQGSLYVLNDEDPNNRFLELVALFAFDIKKHEQRRIKLGEGLLGQTFLEKETNYYRDLPEEYIRITSGLGDANPRSLLIVPLKLDQEVYGIVEMASFNPYEPHEIAFVEKLGETIASTIASVRSAQRNRTLIEQFQQQTEQMRAQEEEMRQNMEELQATQEEIARKERGYIARIEELEAQQNNSQPAAALENARAELARREREHAETVRDLQEQLAAKPARADDWTVAEEVAKALRINLEALEITQEELKSKRY